VPTSKIFIFTIVVVFSSFPAMAASPPYAGTWAKGLEACKIKESYTITATEFEDDLTGEDHCVFTKVDQLSGNSWKVNALCGARLNPPGEKMTFQFETSGNSLYLSGGYRVRNWIKCN
jgi:hypothetical protein